MLMCMHVSVYIYIYISHTCIGWAWTEWDSWASNNYGRACAQGFDVSSRFLSCHSWPPRCWGRARAHSEPAHGGRGGWGMGWRASERRNPHVSLTEKMGLNPKELGRLQKVRPQTGDLRMCLFAENGLLHDPENLSRLRKKWD